MLLCMAITLTVPLNCPPHLLRGPQLYHPLKPGDGRVGALFLPAPVVDTVLSLSHYSHRKEWENLCFWRATRFVLKQLLIQLYCII